MGSLLTIMSEPSSHENYLEIINVLSVIFKESFADPDCISVIEKIPVFQYGVYKVIDFVQPIRQLLDEIQTRPLAKDSRHVTDHGEGCMCLPDEYINLFCLLEERGLIVTSGEWKAKMLSILEK